MQIMIGSRKSFSKKNSFYFIIKSFAITSSVVNINNNNNNTAVKLYNNSSSERIFFPKTEATANIPTTYNLWPLMVS